MNGRIRGLRWWIIGLIFGAAFINFLNRLTVAVLAPVMTVQLGLSNVQFASLTVAFLVAYTISQGLSGHIYDKVGTKRGFIGSVLLWSIVSMAHAFARGLFSLDCLRFLLGLGEGGTWPGAAKVIAEWFPVRERAIAMGICNSGTAVGSVVATPLIVWIQLHYGWRQSFLAVGGMGFVWIIAWAFLYTSPSRSTRITDEEFSTITAGQPAPTVSERLSWAKLLRRREVWGIILARFLGDPVWWLYTTWLPLYLFRVRHLSVSDVGKVGWIPFVAADVGSLFGGWLSGLLMRRGWSTQRARRTVIVSSSVLMCSGIFAASAHSALAALGFVAVVLFGFQSWISNVQTLPSDYFHEGSVGSVMGLGGVGAGLGAMLLTAATGFVVEHYSYTPIFFTAALLPIAATALLMLLTRRPPEHDSIPPASPVGVTIANPSTA